MARNRPTATDTTTPPPEQPKRKLKRTIAVAFLALFAFALLLRTSIQTTDEPGSVSYSTFKQQVREGHVKRVTLRGQSIEVELDQPQKIAGSTARQQWRSVRPPVDRS